MLFAVRDVLCCAVLCRSSKPRQQRSQARLVQLLLRAQQTLQRDLRHLWTRTCR